MPKKKPFYPNSPLLELVREGIPSDFNAAPFWTKISKGRIQARYISPFAVILHQNGVYPLIGKGSWIGHYCIIDGSQGLEIGENCDIASGVHIYTHSTASRCTRGTGKEAAPVKIGRNVFIGPNSVVSLGCVIGDYTLLDALTYVQPFRHLRPETVIKTMWVGEK